MPDLWLPGAVAVPTSNDGGSMLGPTNENIFTWHSYEADPVGLTAVAGAKGLVANGTAGTFCTNPLQGGIAQMIPANRASRMLRNLDGGVQTNRRGRVNLQCEVIAYARDPFTRYWTKDGKLAIQKMLFFADSWNIPRTHRGDSPPATGPFPRPMPDGNGGHVTHAQWKENDHWDWGHVLWSAIDELWGAPLPIPTPTLRWTKTDVINLQDQLEATRDGAWGSNTDLRAQAFRAVAYSAVAQTDYQERLVQSIVDVRVDGVIGPVSASAIIKMTYIIQKILKVTQDGDWGPKTDAAYLAFRKEWFGRF